MTTHDEIKPKDLPIAQEPESKADGVKLALIGGAVVGLGVAAYKWFKNKGRAK